MASGEISGETTSACVPAVSVPAVVERKVRHIRPSDRMGIQKERYFGHTQIQVLRGLCDASSGVGEITVRKSPGGRDNEYGPGTSFLGWFVVDDNVVFGLFTANHLLDESVICNDRNEVTIANQDFVRLTDPPTRYSRNLILPIHKSPFIFTCPLLDVTFIEFDEDTRKGLLSDREGFTFLPVERWDATTCKSPDLHVLHYPGAWDDHTQYSSTGHFDRYDGLQLFHSVSTDDGSSGAPVFNACCKVVAIHTAKSQTTAGNYNVATDATSVLNILIPKWREHRISNPSQTPVVSHHPNKEDMQRYMEDLRKLQLEMRILETEETLEGDKTVTVPSRTPIYYEHPGLKVSDVHERVPIYFIPTSHGWYWSDISPLDENTEPNWVSAKENGFGRGSKNRGKTVVEEANGFSFAKLREIDIGPGMRSLKLMSDLGQMHSNVDNESNKEKENSESVSDA